jgi:hypothetical protein
MLQEGERQIRMVRENLQIVHSRQKSYVDHRRRELSLEVGDFGIPQGVTYERFTPFQGKRQARTDVHWTDQDLAEER